MNETKLAPFTTVQYVTKDGEKYTATKDNGIVTVTGDKNGVRQMPVDDFMKNLAENLPKVDLEKSPAKDTVNFSGNPDKKNNKTLLSAAITGGALLLAAGIWALTRGKAKPSNVAETATEAAQNISSRASRIVDSTATEVVHNTPVAEVAPAIVARENVQPRQITELTDEATNALEGTQRAIANEPVVATPNKQNETLDGLLEEISPSNSDNIAARTTTIEDDLQRFSENLEKERKRTQQRQLDDALLNAAIISESMLPSAGRQIAHAGDDIIQQGERLLDDLTPSSAIDDFMSPMDNIGMSSLDDFGSSVLDDGYSTFSDLPGSSLMDDLTSGIDDIISSGFDLF